MEKEKTFGTAQEIYDKICILDPRKDGYGETVSTILHQAIEKEPYSDLAIIYRHMDGWRDGVQSDTNATFVESVALIQSLCPRLLDFPRVACNLIAKRLENGQFYAQNLIDLSLLHIAFGEVEKHR